MAAPRLAKSPPAGLALFHREGQAFERRYVETGGGQVAYAQAGAGDNVVVLVHGTLTALDDMLLALGPHMPGLRLIAFDRPGFGGSERRSASDAGVFRQAQRLNQTLDVLGIERYVLVGHSFGGAVAVAMAMLDPARAVGVVALAPLVVPELRLDHLLFGPRGLPIFGQGVSDAAHASVDRVLLPILWRGMFLPQAMPRAVTDRFPFALAGEAGATARVGEDCLAAGPDLLAMLAMAPTLRAPIEVLGGAADIVINNGLHGAVLAALAPRGRFHLLPGVGHMIHHVAPDRVAQAVAHTLAAR